MTPPSLLRHSLILPPLLFIAASLIGYAEAAVIYTQGFDTTAPANPWNYTISDVVGTGSFAVSTTAGATDFPPNQRIESGDRSLQVTAVSGAITFNDIDVSLYDDLYITVRVSSPSATSANGTDSNDYLRVFTSIDGAAYDANILGDADIALRGTANSRWGFNATRTATTDAGTNLQVLAQSGTSTDNYSTLRINLSDLTSTVGMRIYMENQAGEYWNIDSITLNGTLAVPEPSRMLLLAAGLGCMIFRRRRTRA